MSLYNLARHVQSKGRNGDTMLVHMTPGEVQGLQALAMKHGGSLSINPDTGLPEANFLKQILPTVVGAGLAATGVGMPLAIAAGAGTGLLTSGGNLQAGILGGLGAWGGASLVSGLMGTGAAALGAGAGSIPALGSSTAASQFGTLSAAPASGAFGSLSSAAPASGAFGSLSSAAPSAAGSALSGASNWDKIVGGFQATNFGPAYLKQNMFPIAAATAPVLLGGAANQQATIPPAPTGTIRPYTYSQTRNPEFGNVPGAPYFNQTFTPGTPYTAKEGGIVALASGGPVERMSTDDMKPGMYPQGMMDKTYYATPTQRPASMEVIKSDYDTPVNPITGMQDLGMAGGGIVALAEGGNPMVEEDKKYIYGRTIPTTTGVDMLTVAPNLGQYGKPRPANDPSVAAYNQILAQRAANEYVAQPAPLPILPGGGERATPADTSKIINQYYMSTLGRPAEQAGLDYWTQRKQEGLSLGEIQKAIKDSQEGQIYGLYRDILQRRPDEGGAQFWQQALASGAPIADIRKAFIESPEYQQRTAAGTLTPAATPALGGYIYDPRTGKYIKTTPPPPEDLGGMFGQFANDPGFQSYLQNQYSQYQSAQQGGGGKAGGLMPNNLKSGGISDLGDYSDGGRLLKGPGDGVSDSIPAQIGERQPARLADGEFVVPARIVSELGNGSTDAGARKLYAMMDRIQKQRKKSVGKNKVAVDSKAESLLPA